MGMRIEFRKANYQTLRSELIKNGARDEPFLDKILDLFGIKAGDDYILLDNEFSEEFNSFREVGTFIDNYYNVRDTFSLFIDNTESIHPGISVDDAQDELDVEFDIYPEDDE